MLKILKKTELLCSFNVYVIITRLFCKRRIWIMVFMLFFVTIPVLILVLWGQWTFDIGIQFLSGLLGSDTTIPLTTNLVLKKYTFPRKSWLPLQPPDFLSSQSLGPMIWWLLDLRYLHDLMTFQTFKTLKIWFKWGLCHISRFWFGSAVWLFLK